MRNLKKVISSVAAMALVASSASAFAVTFPDVDASASYANAVQTLTALKVVRGDDKGLFNPDNNVTRAEFTTMAVGALNETAAAQAQMTSEFTDAANTQQHWAAGYIAQGVADGFINGMGDGTFAPDEQVTYAQAAKMLVAAVGYTSYAEAAGGWPSGYVSQASSLGITKGVSATNDTALTRAQCAVMVYNAMLVPLCVIDEWETQVTLTGTVQTPKLKKLDGKENRDYQTLLTDKHDAYLVKGRVISTPRDTSLDKDEVKYNIEVSDNFDDTINISNSNKNNDFSEKFKVGETDAINMQFAYTEAIVQKDEDSDEFTILSITNYGNSKIVEFEADDLADDDKTIAVDQNTGLNTNYVDNVNQPKLPVYKSSSSSTTTKYDLAYGDNYLTTAVMYVNGVEVGVVTDANIKDYILNNTTGKVTLVDKTEVGSTSTDGKYDYIMVTYYVDAVVDYVSASSSSVKVYFKNAENRATRMEWDPDDSDLDLTFTKDGAKIAYTDLNEFDVLSIQYDMLNDSLTDFDYANIVVSSNVVTGNATSKDTTDYTVTVAGTEYDVNENLVDITGDAVELGTEYTFYIDAFGYVAYIDEGSSDKNYGVIVAMYRSSGDDYPTVRLITSDAKVVAYECKDDTEAAKFYSYATTGTANANATVPTGNSIFTKNTIATQIKSGATVCQYKLASGKIKFDKAYTGYGDADLEYKANSQKVGSYSISDAASKLIDMDEYMNNDTSTVSTLSVADFEDEATYTAYFFDKNNDSVYRFGIVFEGTSSIRPETQLAVVAKVNGQKDTENGDTCNSYTVYRANQEVELLIEQGTVYESDGTTAATIAEGSVIAYTMGSEGYAETDDVYVLYTPASTYQGNLANILANNDFNAQLDWVQKVSSGKNEGKYEIAYAGKTSSSKDVFAYVGAVYRKQNNTLELFTKQSNNVSNVADVVDLSLGSATGTYTFDYGKRVDKGVRLEVGTANQTNSTYNPIFINDKNQVQWGLDDIEPMTAFVKEVDGDVTDVILFIAD